MQDEFSRSWQQVSSCLSEECSEAAVVKTRLVCFHGRYVIYCVARKSV